MVNISDTPYFAKPRPGRDVKTHFHEPQQPHLATNALSSGVIHDIDAFGAPSPMMMRLPLEKLGTMHIENITREHIARIMEAMMQTKVKPTTVRNRMSVLRTVLRWSAHKGFRELLDFPKLPPAHYEKFVPPTPDEVATILAAAQSEHIARVVVIGSQFGVRVGPSELLKLTWGDVDLDRRVLRIHGGGCSSKVSVV